MHQFTNQPPQDPRGHNLTLIRCPANKPIAGIITTNDLIGTNTHYWKGRTLPCDVDHCEACSEGLPWRWHGYVGLFSPTTKNHVLFEFTARAAEPLVAYRDAYGKLRGCLLRAHRANSAPNSRVIISTSPADLEKIQIPSEPDLIAALSIIWNLKSIDLKPEGLQKSSPALRHRRTPDGANGRANRLPVPDRH